MYNLLRVSLKTNLTNRYLHQGIETAFGRVDVARYGSLVDHFVELLNVARQFQLMLELKDRSAVCPFALARISEAVVEFELK